MIKLGIVGAGNIGKSHSLAISQNPDCCLVAVCDTVIERAEEIAICHQAKSFTDYKDMCASVEMDAVIINLPHFLHHEVTVYFLEHGVNVLVEKPMAMTAAECDSMIATAKKNGVKLAVGHVQRYFAAYGEVKKLVENGRYGKLCMITDVRNTNYLQNRPKWFLTKNQSGGGIVMNFGAHSLDKIMYVCGQQVETAHAILRNPLSDDDVEINAQLLLQLTGDISATISFCGCPGVYAHETVFYFENGVAKVTAGGNKLLVSENGTFVTAYEGRSTLLADQLCEFVKFLRGEDNMMVTAEYGREIIRALEKVLS